MHPTEGPSNDESKKRKSTDTDAAEDEKVRARREANRLHAFKSRQRSKMLMTELQKTVQELQMQKGELERQNAVLQAQVQVLQQQNAALLQNQQVLLAQQQQGAQQQDHQQQESSTAAGPSQATGDVPAPTGDPSATHQEITTCLTQHEGQEEPASVVTQQVPALTANTVPTGAPAVTLFHLPNAPAPLLSPMMIHAMMIAQQQQQQQQQMASNEQVPPQQQPQTLQMAAPPSVGGVQQQQQHQPVLLPQMLLGQEQCFVPVQQEAQQAHLLPNAVQPHENRQGQAPEEDNQNGLL
jgi:hypothetical protein